MRVYYKVSYLILEQTNDIKPHNIHSTYLYTYYHTDTCYISEGCISTYYWMHQWFITITTSQFHHQEVSSKTTFTDINSVTLSRESHFRTPISDHNQAHNLLITLYPTLMESYQYSRVAILYSMLYFVFYFWFYDVRSDANVRTYDTSHNIPVEYSKVNCKSNTVIIIVAVVVIVVVVTQVTISRRWIIIQVHRGYTTCPLLGCAAIKLSSSAER